MGPCVLYRAPAERSCRSRRRKEPASVRDTPRQTLRVLLDLGLAPEHAAQTLIDDFGCSAAAAASAARGVARSLQEARGGHRVRTHRHRARGRDSRGVARVSQPAAQQARALSLSLRAEWSSGREPCRGFSRERRDGARRPLARRSRIYRLGTQTHGTAAPHATGSRSAGYGQRLRRSPAARIRAQSPEAHSLARFLRRSWSPGSARKRRAGIAPPGDTPSLSRWSRSQRS